MGRTLKVVMLAAGETQRSVARALGVTDPRVSHIIRATGKNGLTVGTVVRFAAVCGARVTITFDFDRCAHCGNDETAHPGLGCPEFARVPPVRWTP